MKKTKIFLAGAIGGIITGAAGILMLWYKREWKVFEPYSSKTSKPVKPVKKPVAYVNDDKTVRLIHDFDYDVGFLYIYVQEWKPPKRAFGIRIQSGGWYNIHQEISVTCKLTHLIEQYKLKPVYNREEAERTE